jgi:MFS family permease
VARPVGHPRHLRAALAHPGFRRLLTARLFGQFGDGVFQASLAGTVLFNPERQAHAADVAAGFAVLLLPYSLLGPFAGVLLDRWSRRQVLAIGNAGRAGAVLLLACGIAAGMHGVPFYAAALVIVSAMRFLLSALSAALPHVVADRQLVTANAISATAGTVISAAGGALAIGLRELTSASNAGYAVLAATSALPYLAAAAAARGFARPALGPSVQERARRETAGQVVRGLREGARHLRARPQAAVALAAIALQRLLYGVMSVCVILLYRNYFAAEGFFRAGLAGLSQAVIALGIGGAAAAFVTPAAFRRTGPIRWTAAVLTAGGVVQAALFLPYRLPLVLLAVLLLAFVAQSAKISIDTLVQQQVEDDFRGRVFAGYDAAFNVMLVVAAVLTATALPADGRSPASVLALGAGYLVLAAGYGSAARLAGRRQAAVVA